MKKALKGLEKLSVTAVSSVFLALGIGVSKGVLAQSFTAEASSHGLFIINFDQPALETPPFEPITAVDVFTDAFAIVDDPDPSLDPLAEAEADAAAFLSAIDLGVDVFAGADQGFFAEAQAEALGGLFFFAES